MDLTFSCQVRTDRSLGHIVGECPKDMVPLFELSSSGDDVAVGNRVFYKDGHIVDCITQQRIAKRLIKGLFFLRYTPYA